MTLLRGKKVTVMGLGLHGGGVAAAQFAYKEGAEVTVTDLASHRKLAPSLKKLESLPIKLVLGHHRERDFIGADVVIKGPAVPPDSPYLKLAKVVETDISLFLQRIYNPVLAYTGSKGKSTTVSALHYILQEKFPHVKLGGNITISPLSFLDQLEPSDPVVLELSSWQLADLPPSLLVPKISGITNILYDHQNRYNTFEEYILDKERIFASQDGSDYAIFNDDPYGRRFKSKSRAKTFIISSSDRAKLVQSAWSDKRGGWYRNRDIVEQLVPNETKTPGHSFHVNLLFAALSARLIGMDAKTIYERCRTFPGVPHRLEWITTLGGVDIYNDTASTIPEATVAGIESFDKPLVLIMGGTDKELDLTVLPEALKKVKNICLLAGSATEKLIPLLKKHSISYKGPFGSLEKSLAAALSLSERGDTLLFSPGATSFEMFNNEFDRGEQFKLLVENLAKVEI